MDLGIQGKVAIIAASSKGLGKFSALALSREGAKIVICSRDEDRIKETGDEITSITGNECLALKADVTNPEDIRHLVEQTLDKWNSVDIVITNAGGPPAMEFDNISDEDWMDAFNLTFMSSIRLIRLSLPSMKQNRWGRIINITSIAVKQPIPNLMLSNAIRSGVTGFSRTLADEVAPFNITVNNILPGYTKTDRVINLAQSLAQKRNISTDEVYAEWERKVPLGKIGDPDDFGQCVAFLASKPAGYITGSSLPVDGGFYRGLL